MKKLNRKEASQVATKKSWVDPDKKKKSLSDGRKKAFEARRQAGLNSFPDHQRQAFRLNKYKQYNNFLALFLIENGLDTKNLLKRTKNLNTPHRFTTITNLSTAVKDFVLEAESVSTGVLTYDIAMELITKTLEIKAELFPEQIASIRARERKKEKDTTLKASKMRASKDSKGNTINKSI